MRRLLATILGCALLAAGCGSSENGGEAAPAVSTGDVIEEPTSGTTEVEEPTTESSEWANQTDGSPYSQQYLHIKRDDGWEYIVAVEIGRLPGVEIEPFVDNSPPGQAQALVKVGVPYLAMNIQGAFEDRNAPIYNITDVVLVFESTVPPPMPDNLVPWEYTGDPCAIYGPDRRGYGADSLITQYATTYMTCDVARLFSDGGDALAGWAHQEPGLSLGKTISESLVKSLGVAFNGQQPAVYIRVGGCSALYTPNSEIVTDDGSDCTIDPVDP